MTSGGEGASTFHYTFSPTFGPYLRQCRESAGFTLRKAAEALDVSATWLQKCETTGRIAKPSLDRLRAIATAYGRAASEVETAAGVRRTVPTDTNATVHTRFALVVMYPDIRPRGMTIDWLDSYGARQKQQVLDLVDAFLRLLREAAPDHPLLRTYLPDMTGVDP